MRHHALPERQGLYDPANEHDACGMGFVATLDGTPRHSVVADAITVLKNLDHRGAVGAEVNTGDGAGIVAHEEEGQPLGLQLQQHLQQMARQGGIQGGEGLVQHQKTRPQHEGPGQGEALGQAPGPLGGALIQAGLGGMHPGGHGRRLRAGGNAGQRS